eukprot:236237-Rhodomonas_salina.1
MGRLRHGSSEVRRRERQGPAQVAVRVLGHAGGQVLDREDGEGQRPGSAAGSDRGHGLCVQAGQLRCDPRAVQGLEGPEPRRAPSRRQHAAARRQQREGRGHQRDGRLLGGLGPQGSRRGVRGSAAALKRLRQPADHASHGQNVEHPRGGARGSRQGAGVGHDPRVSS